MQPRIHNENLESQQHWYLISYRANNEIKTIFYSQLNEIKIINCSMMEQLINNVSKKSDEIVDEILSFTYLCHAKESDFKK